jgi:hypothetical protein
MATVYQVDWRKVRDLRGSHYAGGAHGAYSQDDSGFQLLGQAIREKARRGLDVLKGFLPYFRREVVKYFGADVLHVGQGQCQYCAGKVMRLLINDGSHRSWRTVNPEAGKFIPHACPAIEAMAALPEPPRAA